MNELEKSSGFLTFAHKVQVHNSSFNSFSARFFLEFDLNLLVLSSYAIWQENKTISVGFLIPYSEPMQVEVFRYLDTNYFWPTKHYCNYREKVEAVGREFDFF